MFFCPLPTLLHTSPVLLPEELFVPSTLIQAAAVTELPVTGRVASASPGHGESLGKGCFWRCLFGSRRLCWVRSTGVHPPVPKHCFPASQTASNPLESAAIPGEIGKIVFKMTLLWSISLCCRVFSCALASKFAVWITGLLHSARGMNPLGFTLAEGHVCRR